MPRVFVGDGNVGMALQDVEAFASSTLPQLLVSLPQLLVQEDVFMVTMLEVDMVWLPYVCCG